MPKLKRKLRLTNDPVPAVGIFAFLLGICIALFFLKADITELKQYIEVIKYQIQTGNLAAEKIFLYILRKRLYLFIIIIFVSRMFSSRYLAVILTGIFFFAYGIFACGNILVFGFSGFLTGIFLMIPQWTVYLAIFYLCIRETAKRKNRNSMVHLVLLMTFAGLLILGSLLESYVTLPLVEKIILKI